MKIVVRRHYFSENYTIGKLYIDGGYFCDTLEPSTTAKEYSAVKTGIYSLTIAWSPKFGRYMPRIEVPKRSGILFHVGNYPHDTKGCVLLGMNTIKGSVTASQVTFNSFFDMLLDHIARFKDAIIVEFKNK
nr:MAG TPA_asm: hypothetical protein [Microviridae sp.]